MKHLNDGNCAKCRSIFLKYPGFNQNLWNWFKLVQAKHKNFHAAEAGRGKIDQEADFHRGASKSHWGESAHNFNAAVDTFFLVDGNYSLDEKLFQQIEPEIPLSIEWYGAPGAKFYERPHFQVRGWKVLRDKGQLKLVE